VPPAVAFLPADAGEPAPYVEAPAPPWNASPAPEPGEDTEPDALTVIGPAPEDGADPWEHTPDEVEPEAEPELAERGGIFRRRRR
jgi:hypothetical protein